MAMTVPIIRGYPLSVVLAVQNQTNSSSTWESVTHLDLSNLGLTTVPDFIKNMPNLAYLSLCGNEIEEITDAHFPEKITQLRLTDNKIRRVESLPASLSVLDLEHNDLELLPKCLGNLKYLRLLSLSGNKISANEDSNIHLGTLAYLDLSSNRISVVDKNFMKPLSRVKSLNLKDNPITKISPSLFTSYDLKSLTIENYMIGKKSLKMFGEENNVMVDE